MKKEPHTWGTYGAFGGQPEEEHDEAFVERHIPFYLHLKYEL
jgi:hypothetical protein